MKENITQFCIIALYPAILLALFLLAFWDPLCNLAMNKILFTFVQYAHDNYYPIINYYNYCLCSVQGVWYNAEQENEIWISFLILVEILAATASTSAL